jgi:hypothetical protein
MRASLSGKGCAAALSTGVFDQEQVGAPLSARGNESGSAFGDMVSPDMWLKGRSPRVRLAIHR